jgi:hypothetical protein
MAKSKKADTEVSVESQEAQVEKPVPTIHDLEWTDWVLSHLAEEEKIKGNPTTDGLRRIFEKVMNCTLISTTSKVVQSPTIDNEKRATVEHHVTFVLNNDVGGLGSDYRSVTGVADVYWGNCDKVYRNHPVAVAETRAEGRALRRALRLRKVVAAEEMATDVEDHPDHDTITKISNNQINFIDVIAKRIDVNVSKLIEKLAPNTKNVYNIEHTKAVEIVQQLTSMQQTNVVPEELLGYNSDWK